MSITKTIAAGIAVSGLLLSTAAYASETRADGAPVAAANTAQVALPLTVAKSVKLKRKSAPAAAYSNDVVAPVVVGLALVAAAGAGYGFYSASTSSGH